MSLPKTKVIAIIDEDFRVRRYLERLLGACGYVTVSFAAADEFLVDAELVAPACVVLDIDLKDGSGRELAHHPTLRALTCPVIFTSTSTSASSTGPCLRKPFRAADVLPLLLNALRPR
jgi:FixJ family two-component response regulator